LFTAPAGSGTLILKDITLIIRTITIVLFIITGAAGGVRRYIVLHIAFPILIITVIITHRFEVRADIISAETMSEYQLLRGQATSIRTTADVTEFNRQDQAYCEAAPTTDKT
jgi:hypothetical protein